MFELGDAILFSLWYESVDDRNSYITKVLCIQVTPLKNGIGTFINDSCRVKVKKLRKIMLNVNVLYYV